MFRSLFFLVITLFPVTTLKAQTREIKQEKEVSIKRGELPSRALEQLKQIEGQTGKIKYYKEYARDNISYEAKFHWRGQRWSMEFAADGTFQDLERKIPLRTFSSAMTGTMIKELSSLGKRYRILGAQHQFSWAIDDGRDFDVAMVNPGHKGVVVRYELEVEAKKPDGAIVAYELLMDEEGRLLRKRTNKPFTDTHLLY